MKVRTEPKTERQLMHKISELSKRVAELEASEAELKQAEEALRVSKERYGLATKSGQVGVWDWNLETNEIYLDPNLKAMLGYADHEIRNHLDDWGKYVHPDDVESVMAEAQAHLDGLTPQYEVIHRMLHRDGSIRWFLARGNAIRDANGKPYRVLGTDTDVTERKQAKEALQRAHGELETRVTERTAALANANEQLKREIEERKEAEKEREKLTSLIEQSSEFIGMSTLEGQILYINPAGQRLIGIESLEETETKTVFDYVIKEDLEEFRERILPAILQHGHWEGEFRMKHSRTGKPIPVELCGFLINDPENSQPIAMATVSRDISKRKQAEHALREREKELEIKTGNLEEANAALKVLLKTRDEDKTELEEKVLLNVKKLVEPYLEKLKVSALSETQKVYAEIVEANLNDIISPFSRTLSSRQFNLSPTEIQVANLVKEGKTNKEIAELLNSSPRTIAFHRENIRKKLDLKNKRINLQIHLQSLP